MATEDIRAKIAARRAALTAELEATAMLADAGTPEPEPEPGEPEPAPEPIEEPETAPAPDVAARRRQLLQGIDADIAALISDEELAKIEEEERVKAAAEQKKQALADVRASLRTRARAAHDLIPAGVLVSEEEHRRRQELVTFRVNLPRGGGAPGFRVDGRLYQQGGVYTEPRHVFESLQSNHYRVHLHEIEFRSLEQNDVFPRGTPNGGMRASQVILARMPPPFEVTSH